MKSFPLGEEMGEAMRIITGKYKGRHFEVPRSFSARPTTDFAKENLFNVLQAYIDFDEAPTALSVELDGRHHRLIKQFLDKLQDTTALPVRGDVFQYLAKCREQFDFIFADPPYVLPQIPELPDIVLSRNLLKEGGLFVLEHGKTNDFSQHPRFVEHRSYGSVNFSFFQ